MNMDGNVLYAGMKTDSCRNRDCPATTNVTLACLFSCTFFALNVLRFQVACPNEKCQALTLC